MNISRWPRLGLAVGALGLALSGLSAQTMGLGDIGSYPPQVQKEYSVFADRCSRCHDLSRPLSARYTTEAAWRAVVARMAGKQGAAISPKDQQEIIRFLDYRQKAQASEAASPSAPTMPTSAAPALPSASTAASPAPPAGTGNSILAPPAALAGSSPARAGGMTESGGLRIEVDALPAQPILALADGRWTTEPPGPGENLFLAVRLYDAATGEKVPYATIQARVGGENAPPAKTLRPLFSPGGFQYGANFAAPAGDLEVSLEVEPPSLARVNDDGHRWSSPLNLKLTLRGR